jgi:hypothetical protein
MPPEDSAKLEELGWFKDFAEADELVGLDVGDDGQTAREEGQ